MPTKQSETEARIRILEENMEIARNEYRTVLSTRPATKSGIDYRNAQLRQYGDDFLRASRELNKIREGL